MGLFANAVGYLHDKGILHRRVTALASAIAPLLPKSARVLDVGCGDGLLDQALLDLRPDLRIEILGHRDPAGQFVAGGQEAVKA